MVNVYMFYSFKRAKYCTVIFTFYRNVMDRYFLEKKNVENCKEKFQRVKTYEEIKFELPENMQTLLWRYISNSFTCN